MGQLTNQKHEQFTQLLLDGTKSWRTIMEEMEYKPNQSQFSSLKNSPKIQTRLAELQKEAKTEAIMGLAERLEWLTVCIRDSNQTKGFRLACMKELHEQCGDKVNKVDVNQSTESVIRYVDVELPKKQGLENRDDTEINGSELEGLEMFLMGAENGGGASDNGAMDMLTPDFDEENPFE
jgi:hypothetical protein